MTSGSNYLTSVSSSTLGIGAELQIVNLYPGTKNNVSGMELCILYLVQLSKSTANVTQSLMTILQNNTSLQQQLNNQLMVTELLPVPKLFKDQGAQDSDPYKNSGEVQGFQSKNQQITALRQFFQGQQGCAQRIAQTNQKAANSTISESLQIIQTASGLLKTLEELTYKANISSPPK